MRSALCKPFHGMNRGFRFERLEDRMMLAGNCTAACVNGVLTICGDKCDNQICCRQIDECRWEIKGLCGTTICGKECMIVKDVKCISIDCKGGCDKVTVCDGFLKDGLKICDSKGDTNICVRNICCGGMSIKTDGGKDCVFVSCCDIKSDPKCSGKTSACGVKWDSCCIDTGGGCDTCVVDKVCGSCCKIDVKCGAGDDKLCISRCDVKSICTDSGKGCDKLAITRCKADFCEHKCDKSDQMAVRDNCFAKEKCNIPSCDKIDECIREICDSKEWKESGCEAPALV